MNIQTLPKGWMMLLAVFWLVFVVVSATIIVCGAAASRDAYHLAVQPISCLASVGGDSGDHLRGMDTQKVVR